VQVNKPSAEMAYVEKEEKVKGPGLQLNTKGIIRSLAFNIPKGINYIHTVSKRFHLY
jgi:hypothetical protein